MTPEEKAKALALAERNLDRVMGRGRVLEQMIQKGPEQSEASKTFQQLLDTATDDLKKVRSW